jgi:hypothetical protein
MSAHLPIPDYEHLPFGNLASRVRALDLEQVVALRDHEHAHADRIPVMQLFEQRMEVLQSAVGHTPARPLRAR